MKYTDEELKKLHELYLKRSEVHQKDPHADEWYELTDRINEIKDAKPAAVRV